GQRVASHRILLEDGTVLASGATVGVRRIHRLEQTVRASALVVELSGEGAVLEAAVVHDATGAPVPDSAIAYRATTERPDA
ncbi:MAG: alpha-L-fucosidase, partial [Brachybacterium tyrofermentans]